MRGKTSALMVTGLLLLVATVAAANNRMLNGPSPGLAVNGSTAAQSSTPTTGTTSTSTAGSGTTNGTATASPATGTSTTGTNGGALPTSTLAPSASGTPAIDQIVSIARTVEAGTAPVSAFTVPTGQQLVLTDVIVTNPGTTPSCGASISAAGAAAPTTGGTPPTNGTTTPGVTPPVAPPTTGAAASVESGTGPLCVPAQTSLGFALTTGLEFSAGQSVALANTTPATTPGTTTPGATPPVATGTPLHYHLRGFLVTPLGS